MQQRSPRRRAPQARAASESSPWKPSPERAREREVKREAVILAAARCFRERGYHHSSLDDIAALLNVTKPTIYYYVANKEEILFECFRSGLDQIQSVFPALKDSKDSGRLRLLRLVERYVEAVTSEFGWCMVRAEDQDLSPAMSGRIRALKSQIDQCMRQLIREGIADGSIARCDSKMSAFALAGALNWIGHWFRRDESLTPAQIAERFIDLFTDGLAPRAPAAPRSRASLAPRG